MVSTLDSESSDPGSNPGRTSFCTRPAGTTTRQLLLRCEPPPCRVWRARCCCGACYRVAGDRDRTCSFSASGGRRPRGSANFTDSATSPLGLRQSPQHPPTNQPDPMKIPIHVKWRRQRRQQNRRSEAGIEADWSAKGVCETRCGAARAPVCGEDTCSRRESGVRMRIGCDSSGLRIGRARAGLGALMV
jgi:hypothetical protein